MPRGRKPTYATEPKAQTEAGRMTAEEALKIIEAVARGEGDKTQAEAAKEWLRINGAGEVYTRYIIEVVHTYKNKPQSTPLPKISLPAHLDLCANI